MSNQDAKHRHLIGHVLTVFILFCLVQNYAFGTFITYTDRATFLAAAAGASLTATNEDFTVDPGDPFTIDDGSGNSVTLDITSGNHSVNELRSGVSGLTLSLSSTGAAGSVAGIGFDFAYFFVGNNFKSTNLSLNDLC